MLQDQGAISLRRKHYKKNLLTRALSDYGGTTAFLSNITLHDCLILLKNVWNSLKDFTRNKIQKALLSSSCNIDEKVPSIAQLTNNEILNSVSERRSLNANDEEDATFPQEICNKLSQVLAQLEDMIEKSNSLLLEWLETALAVFSAMKYLRQKHLKLLRHLIIGCYQPKSFLNIIPVSKIWRV